MATTPTPLAFPAAWWQNQIPGETNQVVFGNKPYGSYWKQITEAAAQAIIAANAPAPIPPVKSDAAKAAAAALATIAADVTTPAPLKDLLTKVVAALQ